MLLPKRVKYRKQFRGRMKGRAHRGNTVAHGQFGLMALEPAWVTNRQIEAARIAATRHMQRRGQIWIRVFPDKPYSKKPLRPADLAQFPWEKKDNGAGAAATKGTSSEERVKELLGRMEKNVNPSF